MWFETANFVFKPERFLNIDRSGCRSSVRTPNKNISAASLFCQSEKSIWGMGPLFHPELMVIAWQPSIKLVRPVVFNHCQVTGSTFAWYCDTQYPEREEGFKVLLQAGRWNGDLEVVGCERMGNESGTFLHSFLMLLGNFWAKMGKSWCFCLILRNFGWMVGSGGWGDWWSLGLWTATWQNNEWLGTGSYRGFEAQPDGIPGCLHIDLWHFVAL